MQSPLLPELKSQLDRLVGEADLSEDEFVVEEIELFREASQHFLAADTELLDQATDPLWAYYRSTAEEFTTQQRVDYGIPELPPSCDIWEQVTMRLAPSFSVGRPPLSPGRSYMSFEGEVSWEPEHGLQLVIEDGLRVCKVGPYDGHVTNARAFGMPRFWVSSTSSSGPTDCE